MRRVATGSPHRALVSRLFGRDYVYPEQAANTVLENGAGLGAVKLVKGILKIGPKEGEPPVTRIAPGGGLKAHEGSGKGHTLAKHVGQSDEELAQRLARGPKPKVVSTFSDRAIAEDAVSGALTAQRPLVDVFLKSSKRTLIIEQKFDRDVGRVLTRDGSAARPSKTARIVLSKDSSPLGYHIVTSFPVP